MLDRKVNITSLYWARAELIRQYLITGRKHVLIKKCMLNKLVRLLTRLYGNNISIIQCTYAS